MESLPKWLSDEFAEDVVKLLRGLIAFYTIHGSTPKKRVTKSLLPSLYSFAKERQRDYVIDLLNHLQDEGILLLTEQDGNFKHIQLIEDAIPDLRVWLDMPEKSLSVVNWQKAIQHLPKNIVHLHEPLSSIACFDVFDPQKILISLSRICDFICLREISAERISWRQLSAHFFYGDSKYLDVPQRRSTLLALFPDMEIIICERPLQLSVFLVDGAEKILFVENWDAFLGLINHNGLDDKYYLIYTAGFKASAKNIRIKKSVQFFYSGDFSNISLFESAWFNSDIFALDAYFWGDLDYSGLEILNKLSVSFPNIKAWREGYDPMLKSLRSGYGHTSEQTSKEKQRISSVISCEYAQSVLLPALDDTKLMLDQEWSLYVFK